MPILKTTVAKKDQVVQEWWVVDATDQVLGRLATRLATILMGKHKPIYTPHVDTGDFIVVINAQQVKLTGNKRETKEYQRYSGYPGGLKRIPFKEMLARRPEVVFKRAVGRMLPKSKLGRHMLFKMKVYAGPDHPHQAQQPKPLTL